MDETPPPKVSLLDSLPESQKEAILLLLADKNHEISGPDLLYEDIASLIEQERLVPEIELKILVVKDKVLIKKFRKSIHRFLDSETIHYIDPESCRYIDDLSLISPVNQITNQCMAYIPPAAFKYMISLESINPSAFTSFTTRHAKELKIDQVNTLTASQLSSLPLLTIQNFGHHPCKVFKMLQDHERNPKHKTTSPKRPSSMLSPILYNSLRKNCTIPNRKFDLKPMFTINTFIAVFLLAVLLLINLLKFFKLIKKRQKVENIMKSEILFRELDVSEEEEHCAGVGRSYSRLDGYFTDHE